MIYDCPKCQTPQEAGRTSCPRCQTEFDGPVPSDAIVPPEEVAPVTAPTALVTGINAVTTDEDAASDEGVAASEGTVSANESQLAVTEPVDEAVTEPVDEAVTEPVDEAVTEPVDEIEPPQEETVPLPEGDEPLPSIAAAPLEEVEEVPPPLVHAESQPYLTSPSYSPPPYVPPLSAPQPLQPASSAGVSRLLLIALPVVLVLVLGGFFYAHSLNSDSGNSEMPPSVTPSSSAPMQTATPPGAPVYLQGDLSSDAARKDPQIKMLIGRWEAKSSNYYVFNNDGTGSRGSITGSQKNQPFLWNLVQKRLMLYGDTNDKLRFNPGPDADTIFLRGDNGRYVQYTRTKI